MILPPKSEIGHHYNVTNITVTAEKTTDRYPALFCHQIKNVQLSNITKSQCDYASIRINMFLNRTDDLILFVNIHIFKKSVLTNPRTIL